MSAVSTEPQVSALPEEPKPAGEHKTVRRTDGISALQSLVTIIVIAVFVITFIVQASQISSESMEKTLLVGDYLLVDKVHYGQSHMWGWLLPYRSIQRQDIIVFRYPVNPKQHFVKRVVAVPCDRVRLNNKHVYVNGVRQDDDYATFNSEQHDKFRDNFPDGGFYGETVSAKWFLQARKLLDDNELIVPQGSFFVLGDNRDDSYDSRYWGFVPAENVVGRPWLIYWSMDRTTAATGSDLPSDRLSSLAHNVANLVEGLRWNRMLRTVQ
jgi:signal peptidase I